MSNPLLKDKFFMPSLKSTEIMTLSGAINKGMILWICLATGAFCSWTHPNAIIPLLFPILIVAFASAIIQIFKQTTSSFLSPVYAICEGFLLGTISLHFEKVYHGVVLNAVLLTICTLFCTLAAYKIGILKATSKFKKIIIFSTSAIALVYTVNFLLSLLGFASFLRISDSSNLSIIMDFAIAVIASLNLIIDFDFIENAVRTGAPKHMEWYAAFSLMVTIVWLYCELLRIISKLKVRD
jgi:uncharacterized YccA/Bax inhibitor family protein